MPSHSHLFADQLLTTVGSGREPSCDDLREVAARIWIDGARGRTRDRWDALTRDCTERVIALRAASLALFGSVLLPCG